MHWQVVFTDEARQEFNQLPAREQSVMIHALDKLAAEGPALPYPHSSAVLRRRSSPRAAQAFEVCKRQFRPDHTVAEANRNCPQALHRPRRPRSVEIVEPGRAVSSSAQTSHASTSSSRVAGKTERRSRCHTTSVGTSRNLTAAVHQEEGWYVAQCLEVDVASQGRTIEEALANLAEAVALYLEEVDDPQQHVTATPLVTSFQVTGAA